MSEQEPKEALEEFDIGLWEWKLAGRFDGPNPMAPQQRMAL